jgi:hypothetical protein
LPMDGFGKDALDRCVASTTVSPQRVQRPQRPVVLATDGKG